MVKAHSHWCICGGSRGFVCGGMARGCGGIPDFMSRMGGMGVWRECGEGM